MLLLLAAGLLVAAAPGSAIPSSQEAWRDARWGMTPEQVVEAFKGEVRPLHPPVDLKDGSALGAAIDGFAFEGMTFDVRFVFRDGKLVLVSLRTPQSKPADAEAYARLRNVLVKKWGAPLEDTADDNFIDMRQTRWNRGPDRADLKYIPGVVAIVFYPRPAVQ